MMGFGRIRLGKHRRRLLLHSSILLAVAVVFAVLTLTPPFTSFKQQFSDLLFLSESSSPVIVIVAVDDDTLAEYGRFQEWPRSHHVDLVEQLSQAGAKVIGFDILFTDTSPDDPALGQAMSDAGNVVSPVAADMLVQSDQPELTYYRFLWPTSTLRNASAAIGHAVIALDDDNVVRRVPLVIADSSGQSYPSFSLAVAYMHYFGQPPPSDYPLQDGTLQVFSDSPALARDIPVNATKSMRTNYTGEPGNFLTLSFRDVVLGNFDSADVRNKIVLVGMMETTGIDTWATPVSARMAGVEIHANTIDTILRARFLNEFGGFARVLFVLLLAGIVSLSLSNMSLLWGGLLAAGLIIVYVIAAFLTFDRGYILDFIYPPVAVLLVYIANIACRITAERADKRQVKDLFGKYVSHEVADEIIRLSDADRLSLGGERREVTVLFTDIRGFTQLSGRSEPEEIIDMLNEYFTAIIARIVAYDGMVNKFAGDNIMAVWNAPQSQPDHAVLAVKAALESQQAIRELQEAKPDLPKVQFGFGLNTGEAIAGNVGSEGRLEYTVIGDAVNVASRICGAALGGQVWISSQTYAQVKTAGIQARELEPQSFKGVKEAVTVYEVVQHDIDQSE